MNSEIAIVGAGIGGLTLALALEQKNISYVIYEQANSFEALGYGIQISPNAVHVLHALGLAEDLKSISHECKEFELRSFESDSVLANWRHKSAVPYYQCRRADLHALLFDGLKQKENVRFSQRVESFESDKDGVSLTLSDGCTLRHTALVGADGVNSSIRKSIYPNTKPHYSGYAAYRAILPWSNNHDNLLGRTQVWMGANKHVVLYPNGKDWLNLVCIEKTDEVHAESWSHPVDKTVLKERFANSGLLGSMLKEFSDTSEPCFRWGLYEHEPLSKWSQENVTLLGDAAHAMVPFMAQGAAMAIEDAYVFANCLASCEKTPDAFIQYEHLRKKRATKVQKTSLRNADIFHASGLQRGVRDSVTKLVNAIRPQLFSQRTNWIYEYDVTRLEF